MASRFPQGPFLIEVSFRPREDGGLIARCDKVPNFYLSHSDHALVMSDVQPALETILSDMFGADIKVDRLPDIDEALRQQPHLPAYMLGEGRYLGRAEAA